MHIKQILLSLFLAAASGASAQTTVCQPFGLDQVRLLPSRFQENMKRDSAWIMQVPVNRLLHSFRNTSGTFSASEGGYDAGLKLGGWESPDCDLRGHTTGHLLSALATLYAQTKSPAVKAKADSLLSGLKEVQDMYGTGYLSAFGEGLINRNIQGKSVWAPWYTLHKIMQGLIDQYQLCGSEQALMMARRMGEWAWNKTHSLSEETRLKMIRNEFGGFNDAMYQLYAITQDDRFLQTARFFYHNDKVDPLKAGNPDLGTLHANTFIPKLLGEARNYEMFGQADSRSAAELLFATLAYKHAFATGEVSDKEHLFKPEDMHKHLTGYDGENCCTFNLLKLADHVFSWNATSNIADYYERALYNHILGQQDPQSSMVCYFTPLQPGAYRLYSTRDSSFWCCVGSGFESHVKYASSIYFHSDKALWVNLLIPSRLDWDGTTVEQRTDFPAQGQTVLTIGGRDRRFALNLRRPYWATSMKIRVNGKTISAKATKQGYVAVERLWKAGDKVEVTYGMELRAEAMPGSPETVAMMWGPVVMAGKFDAVDYPFSNPRLHNDYYTKNYEVPAALTEATKGMNPKGWKQTGTLRFENAKGQQLIPFYDAHHCRYTVYWTK